LLSQWNYARGSTVRTFTTGCKGKQLPSDSPVTPSKPLPNLGNLRNGEFSGLIWQDDQKFQSPVPNSEGPGPPADVYRRICADFPKDSGLRERARHIWTEYLRWALERPDERKASVLLNLSMVVSGMTRERISAGRKLVEQTMEELGKRGAFKDLPPGFASSAMAAMQEAVMEMAAKKPRQKALLVEQAFDAFWRMAK